MGAAWIDISVPLTDRLPAWPDEPKFVMRTMSGPGRGRTSAISLGTHTGTHVDAPIHFVATGPTVDQAPPEVLNGPAHVIQCDATAGVSEATLAALDLPRRSRLLFKTRPSPDRWFEQPWSKDFAGLDVEAARYLAGKEPLLVGIDSLSVAQYGSGQPVHELLLKSGTWLLEGLDLAPAEPGTYDLVCLPLRIKGADGAPARAFLRKAQ